MESVKPIKVLAIDDHKSVLEVYEMIFGSIRDKFGSVQFVGAVDCRSAYEAIEGNLNVPFDVAVIDYNIPEWEEKRLYSGYDIAANIRRCMPGCRIIFCTMKKDAEVCGKILRRIQPEGFVHKIDCNFDELVQGFRKVLENETFYSKSILEFVVYDDDNATAEIV